MYLFQIFRSFLPLRNPIGFGASDFVVLALAILMVGLLVAVRAAAPYIRTLSEHTRVCMVCLFGLAIVLRLALLAPSPAPIPSGADDFSYLLLGDTLAHLRLANSPHPLHQFFEAVFVLQQPTYASIYPLGQGIVLACGQLLFHSPWAGVLISSGVFCALCYWMLRAWIAPVWALAGGLLAIIEFGPLSSWTNSYWGGAVSAIAGCLVFGSLPRLRETPKLRYGAMLGAGLALQILTRPLEAIFLSFAALLYLAVALKPTLVALGVVATASGITLLHDKAVTHGWTTMPYMLSRYQYGVPATFTFQPNPVPHNQMTAEQDLDYRAQSAIHGPGTDSLRAYFARLAGRFRYLRFFLLPPLYVALVFCVPQLRQQRYLWAGGTILLFVLGTNFYPYFYPHYISAGACLFVLFSVVGLQRLPRDFRTCVWLLCGVSFAFWYALYARSDDSLLGVTAYQSWHYINRGDPQGRAAIEHQLTHSPGSQLVFVRYSSFHRFEEWIHNAAEIDSAQIVWANDLGTDENEKLLQYYPHRTAWLLQPDARAPALAPYPSSSGPFLTVH